MVTRRFVASIGSGRREQGLDDSPSVIQVCDQAVVEALRAKLPAAPPPTAEELKKSWEMDQVRFAHEETFKLGMIQLAPDAGAERVLAD